MKFEGLLRLKFIRLLYSEEITTTDCLSIARTRNQLKMPIEVFDVKLPLWAAAEMFAFWVVFDTFELVGETPRISLELRRRLL